MTCHLINKAVMVIIVIIIFLIFNLLLLLLLYMWHSAAYCGVLRKNVPYTS